MSSFADHVSAYTAISFCALCWILTFILLFYAFKFYQFRTTTLYTKRRGDTVILYTIFGCIFLSIAVPLYFIGSGTYTLSAHQRSSTHRTLHILAMPIGYSSFMLCISLWFSRYYLMAYDIRDAQSRSSIEWKKFITHDVHILKNDMWFTRHRSTLGNARYIYKRALMVTVPMVLWLTAEGVLKLYGVLQFKVSLYVVTFLLVLALVVYVALWRTTPCMNDAIYISREFRLMSYSLCVAMSIWVIGVVLSFIPKIKETLIPDAVMALATVIGMAVISLTSTYWVTLQMKGEQDPETRFLQQAAGNRTQETNISSLDDVLREDRWMNEFMRHLMNEFSIEIMISLIEFYHFRVYGLEAFGGEIGADDRKKMKDIEIMFSPQCPQSDIVYARNQYDETGEVKKSYKLKAYKLYEKYVVRWADFAINIRYQTRWNIENLMASYNEWMDDAHDMEIGQVITLFDDIISKLLIQLSHSNQRFLVQRV